MRPHTHTLVLASQSPRRRRLLADAGIAFETAPHDMLVDDTDLNPGRVTPGQWATALAYLKAAGTAQKLERMRGSAGAERRVILGADTVVVRGTEMYGKARDAADAERIVRALTGGRHEVITGVCLLDATSGTRRVFADRAMVDVGAISEDSLRAYLATGAWVGKAGAYNLEERMAAGWPITCEGDPTTVVGLPMRRLIPVLAAHRKEHVAVGEAG